MEGYIVDLRPIELARIHQILALNDKMLSINCVSRNEHEFIRSLQVKKLTELQKCDTIKTHDEHSNTTTGGNE